MIEHQKESVGITEECLVFSLDTADYFAVLASAVHYFWVLHHGATLRTDLRYTPSDCFETFPFPTKPKGLGAPGELCHEHRRHIMLARQEGLTKTYNRFHSPEEVSADIQKLRQLHVGMDHAVAAAYGWTDLDLAHDFHETKQGVRYTISEPARREILARLLKLNHERYAEEVQQGLHDSKPKRAAAGGKPRTKKAATKAKPATVATSLFDLAVVDPAFPATDRDKLLCGLLCDLVAAYPGLPSTAYLDALVIAVRYGRHSRLLTDKEQTQFTTLAERLLGTSQPANESLPWADLVSLLTQRDALRKEGGETLERGDRHDEVRAAYPACDPVLIRLLHKAAANLRELQSAAKPVPQGKQPALAEFDQDKQALCGVRP